MEENIQDKLARAYAMILSLRENIKGMKSANIPEIYVQEYHSVLDKLEGLGFNLSEYRIPDSMVKPDIGVRVTSVSGEDKTLYSGGKCVDKSFILIKLDAILGYFEIVTSEKPREIGFRTPKK